MEIAGQYCFKAGNHVHIEFSVKNGVPLSHTTALALLPIKYAPKVNKGCGILIICNANGALESIGMTAVRIAPSNNPSAYYALFQNFSTADIASGKSIRVFIDYVI